MFFIFEAFDTGHFESGGSHGARANLQKGGERTPPPPAYPHNTDVFGNELLIEALIELLIGCQANLYHLWRFMRSHGGAATPFFTTRNHCGTNPAKPGLVPGGFRVGSGLVLGGFRVWPEGPR